MYLSKEIFLLSPLILYAFVRIFFLARRPAVRALLAAFSLILLAAYPLAEKFSHGGRAAGIRVPLLAGYDALPFLMYLVLTVILIDLIIGALRLARVLSRDKVRAPRFRASLLGAALLVPTIFVAAGILNEATLRTQVYPLEIPRRASTVERLRIAFASDLHLGDMTGPGFMKRFVDKVNSLEPDIVLLGGDILEGDRGDARREAFEAGFRRIKARYGVYAVAGNHDGYAGGAADGFFQQAGMTLLRDAVVRIDDAFYLAGRKDGRTRNRKSVEDLLRDTPDDLPVVLLDHRPTDLENVSRSGRIDIQLSGHTHNGQLFPVNLITRHQYPKSWGLLKKGRTSLIVSSGVQLWGPRVRTAGASEIVLVDLLLRPGDRPGS